MSTDTNKPDPEVAAAAARSLAKRKALASFEPDHPSQPPKPGVHDPHTDKPNPGPAGTAAERRRASPSIHRARIKLLTDAGRTFQVDLEHDETYAESCNPQFLGLKADNLKPGDTVRIVGHQFAFIADRLVVRSDQKLQAVWTCEISHIDLADRIRAVDVWDQSLAKIDESAGGFRILVGSEIAADGFSTYRAAQTWLERRAKGPLAE